MDINQVNMIKKFYTQYLRLLNRKFLLIIVFPVIAYLAIAIVYIISFSKIEFINTQGGTFPMRVTTYFTFIFITFLIIINFFAFFFLYKKQGLNTEHQDYIVEFGLLLFGSSPRYLKKTNEINNVSFLQGKEIKPELKQFLFKIFYKISKFELWIAVFCLCFSILTFILHEIFLTLVFGNNNFAIDFIRDTGPLIKVDKNYINLLTIILVIIFSISILLFVSFFFFIFYNNRNLSKIYRLISNSFDNPIELITKTFNKSLFGIYVKINKK
ncbi:hypothetical protein [Mesomycoplasma ovipneumoniae]|uniref:hypothetical protein n=2 Tax=Mesomycoplasma ovipneumoniae TaxID=29562 RepID=UPI000B070BA6|nr:hypothetical protein [Mesomycoplasma ovipneumoniae]MDW2833860.1 hypothetical protein [Mesomycoplasma ovipneumoniae]